MAKFSDGTLLTAVWASLSRILIGYTIGTALAILIGSLMGWFRYVEYVFDPIVECMRPVPPLAYIPLIILWIGIGEESRILVLVITSFVVCIVPTFSGMKQVPKVYVEAARTLGASEATIFYKVAIPFAVPFIFAGMRVGMAASWATLVAAELVAAQSGLGYMLQAGRRFFDTSLVMVGIFCIGVLAFIMDRIFRTIQVRMSRWEEVSK
ncbi:ABC transporter permease [Devosia rhodophyticola]|uniref:ABC transporter permease n=1 Tax=Devosia rhodophyticola TaxID=3026423 RepID=A0ABY7YXN1_9HYPH|nr:ABC transporter permease [Devosia rhodophyticola]WDR06138.1 ABC transporter permease [Devosia rhodophyticola]